MKFYILLFLSVLLCFGINAKCTNTRIINNSNASVHVDYDLPIFSRADTEVKPIKSQQELQDLLHEAILKNSTQEIMQVVKAGADVNLFKDGKAPIRWATIFKKYNSVETLKRCGAILPCPKNMLYRAILNDSADDVKNAINAGADPNDENIISQGLHPLGLAVFLTKFKAAQALLECGAKSDLMDSFMGRYGEFRGVRLSNPLSYALLMMHDVKTALILLKYDKNTPVSRILTCGGDPFEYIVTHIDSFGIKDMILEFLQELINRGYDINSSVNQGQIIGNNIVQYKSAWVSAICSPFYFVELLELLMKNGANPNQPIHGGCRWTPLHIAIQANNLSAVKFLLDAGADLTKKAGPSVPGRRSTTNPPQTALSYAKLLALENVENAEIVNLLINRGAPY